MLFGQLSPVDGFEPRVILNLIDAIKTQARFSVSFNEPIDKIYAARIPVIRDIFFTDLDLVGEDFFSYFFSGFAHIRPLNYSLLTVPNMSS